jgi:hypothetical protein
LVRCCRHFGRRRNPDWIVSLFLGGARSPLEMFSCETEELFANRSYDSSVGSGPCRYAKVWRHFQRFPLTWKTQAHLRESLRK